MDPRFEPVTKAMRGRLQQAIGDRELSEVERAAFDIAVKAGALLMVLDAEQSLHGPLADEHAAAYAGAYKDFDASLRALRIRAEDVPSN